MSDYDSLEKDFKAIKRKGGRPKKERDISKGLSFDIVPQRKLEHRNKKNQRWFAQAIVDYALSAPLWKVVKKTAFTKMGPIETDQVVAGDIPNLAEVANQVCWCRKEDLIEWAKKDKDLAQALDVLKSRQEEFITTHSLSGQYEGRFAQFYARAVLKWSDDEAKLTHDGKGPRALVRIERWTEEEKPVIEPEVLARNDNGN